MFNIISGDAGTARLCPVCYQPVACRGEARKLLSRVPTMTTGVVFLRFLREQHSGPFRPPPSLLWAMLTSFGLLLLLLVKAILCYKGEETSLANISFLRNSENTPADLRRRFLRGTGNFVLSTSDTNGGQIIGGVPWPSQSDRVPSPADRANYAQQVNELLNANYFVHENSFNGIQQKMYDRMALYAKLQARAEDPRVVASMQTGISSPVYQDLEDQVADPSFLTRLQAFLYRAAPRYTQIMARVQDPSYGTELQQKMYRGDFRPGPDAPARLSAKATAVQTAPRPPVKRNKLNYPIRPHVP